MSNYAEYLKNNYNNNNNNIIPIQIKKNQNQNGLKKEMKKEKKNTKKNQCMSDVEFESLMSDNKKQELIKYNIPNLNEINTNAMKVYDTKLIGEEILEYIKEIDDKPNACEFLIIILSKISDINNIEWINMDKYGSILKYLLENNLEEQFIFLLLIQKYCEENKFPKILIKNSEKYCINILFQKLFINDIIEETVYNKWEDNLDNIEGMTEKIKNTLIIQTTEFFMFLKTVFDDDNDDNNEKEKDNEKINFEENVYL